MSFSLRAILGLDASGFESGLLLEERAAKASGKRIKENLSGGEGFFGKSAESFIGGAAVGYALDKIAEGYEIATEKAHEFHSVSLEIGASVQNVQVYQEAFDGTEHLAASFRSLAEARKNALAGSPESQKFLDDFQRLGVSADDLRSKSMDEIFRQIGESIKGANVDADELAAISETLGRSGVQMIDGFKRGIKELHEEMAKKGELLDEQDIKTLNEAHYAFDALERKRNLFFSESLLGWKQFIDFVTKGETGTPKLLTANQAYDQIKANKAANDAEKAAAADAAHKATMAEVAAIDAKTADIQFRALSADEKRVALAQQRAAIEEQLRKATFDSYSNDAAKVAAAKLRQQLAQIEAEQASLKPDKEEKEKPENHPERQDVNAAQRTGAFVYQAEGVTLQKQTVGLLGQIHDGIKTLISRGGTF